MPLKSNEIEGMFARLSSIFPLYSSCNTFFYVQCYYFVTLHALFLFLFHFSLHSRFACPFCGKCVRSKENLKLHVRKHTGERPFVCLFCGRAFGGKSDLTRHLRIHTGERPYHCESCGKCFARADYLSKHLTTHVHNSTPR